MNLMIVNDGIELRWLSETSICGVACRACDENIGLSVLLPAREFLNALYEFDRKHQECYDPGASSPGGVIPPMTDGLYDSPSLLQSMIRKEGNP